MQRYKTLAVACITKKTPVQAYLETVDISKHCFAVCMLFVTGNLLEHFTETKKIQSKHENCPAGCSSELHPDHLETFALKEQQSKQYTPQDIPALIKSLNPQCLIVFENDTLLRHCIGIKKKSESEYLILNTSNHIQGNQLKIVLCNNLQAYLSSICEKNAIQTLQIVYWESKTL